MKVRFIIWILIMRIIFDDRNIYLDDNENKNKNKNNNSTDTVDGEDDEIIVGDTDDANKCKSSKHSNIRKQLNRQ